MTAGKVPMTLPTPWLWLDAGGLHPPRKASLSIKPWVMASYVNILSIQAFEKICHAKYSIFGNLSRSHVKCQNQICGSKHIIITNKSVFPLWQNSTRPNWNGKELRRAFYNHGWYPWISASLCLISRCIHRFPSLIGTEGVRRALQRGLGQSRSTFNVLRSTWTSQRRGKSSTRCVCLSAARLHEDLEKLCDREKCVCWFRDA